jgi:hypothetical protein
MLTKRKKEAEEKIYTQGLLTPTQKRTVYLAKPALLDQYTLDLAQTSMSCRRPCPFPRVVICVNDLDRLLPKVQLIQFYSVERLYLPTKKDHIWKTPRLI